MNSMQAVAESDVTAEAEWRHHWKLVLASTAGIFLSVSHIYSFGVLLEPMERDLGWSRSKITSGLTFVSVFSVLLAPWIGILIDRIGTRRISLTGVVAYILGLFMVGMVTLSVWFWWASWSILAVGAVCLKPTVWTAAVASRFNRYRGLAFGIALSGTGLGAMLLPVTIHHVESHYGWRSAYLSMSIAGLLVILPILYFFFNDARSDRGRTSGATPGADRLAGISRRQALLSLTFYKLILSSFLGTSAIIAISVNFIPIISMDGVGRSTASIVVGLIGFASIIGRISFGVFLDKTNARLVGGCAFLLPCLSCVALIYSNGTVLASSVIAFCIGLSLGGEIDILAYLSTKYFGMKNYGFLFGCIAGMMSLAAGMGPLFLSTVFDLTGSYHSGLLMLVPVFAFVALLIFSMGEYPLFETSDGHA